MGAVIEYLPKANLLSSDLEKMKHGILQLSFFQIQNLANLPKLPNLPNSQKIRIPLNVSEFTI